MRKEGRGFQIPRKAAAGILANHKVSCEMIEREEGKMKNFELKISKARLDSDSLLG